MIYKLKVKDKNKVLSFVSKDKDSFEEWYITVDNKRLFLYDPEVLGFYLRKIKFGEIILGNDKEDAFIFTWGLSNKLARNYIKIMSTDTIRALEILQDFLDKYGNYNLYAKIKKDNPLKSLYLDYGFVFKGGRGKEILLAREVI